MKTVLFSLLALFGFSSHAQVLATVGNSKITVEEFNRRLEDIKKQAVNPPTPEQFLEDLVRFKVGVQEAEKMKLANDPLVKERFDQVLYNSLLEKQLGSKVEAIKITDAEMKDFYKKNPEVRLAHILIDLKANATPEEHDAAKKRALEILDDVKKSKRPFEELVKLYSDDLPTKEMGGDIGYQSRVTLVPLIYDTAMNMKIGEVRGLIETKFGFHILKLVDRRSYDLADKRQIRAALFDEKRAKIFNEYFDKLKKQYKIEIDKAVLRSVKK
jgi:peptidyl-prolyl cis-trans isomerase C/peptidyl-prolyl cis-trans isomerase D